MENTKADKLPQDLPLKYQKLFYLTQIWLRISAIATTLAATYVMLTTRQSIEAKYSYSSAFKFFAFANGVACAFSVLSLLYALIIRIKGSNPPHYFFLFIHDLLLMSLVLAGCATATAVGYKGNHIGWTAICDQLGKFCDRVTSSVILSYLSYLFLLVLAIRNAGRSRHFIF